MPLISFSKESLDVVVAQLELLVLQGDVLVCPGDCDDYSPSGHRDYELDHHGDHDDYDPGGVHPNSHKHFIPYMGFCASIWDSVRHHCHHHHHHHHDHQK